MVLLMSATPGRCHFPVDLTGDHLLSIVSLVAGGDVRNDHVMPLEDLFVGCAAFSLGGGGYQTAIDLQPFSSCTFSMLTLGRCGSTHTYNLDDKESLRRAGVNPPSRQQNWSVRQVLLLPACHPHFTTLRPAHVTHDMEEDPNVIGHNISFVSDWGRAVISRTQFESTFRELL